MARRGLVVERVGAELVAVARVVVLVVAGVYRLSDRWVERAARRSPLLDAAGLGLLAWSAGMLAAPAGVAAAGVGVLLMSWRLSR